MLHKISMLIIISILLLSCNSSKDLIAENVDLKTKNETLKNTNTSKLKAVLEVNNLNIIYRGIKNPIRISFPSALKITATGEGLTKKDDFGNYVMVPLSGDDVDIKIQAEIIDGSIIEDVKTLRVKDIGKLTGKINGIGCGNKCDVLMKKTDFKNAKITAILDKLLFDVKITVIEFKIHIPNHKSIKVEGNRITDEVFNKLNTKTSIDDEIIIFDIRVTSTLGARMKPASPIGIRIVK